MGVIAEVVVLVVVKIIIESRFEDQGVGCQRHLCCRYLWGHLWKVAEEVAVAHLKVVVQRMHHSMLSL